eukprot:TRINITY_DN135483_c0_g1_i1.p1 TRINITY_DN135483_c0_g1~~TRINITY_DN135483_c0_g1_i1.p1  ORF type:complete len:83 (+),score=9.29 TRINITY_DN135483_c0_g1_i1:136-384(+)
MMKQKSQHVNVDHIWKKTISTKEDTSDVDQGYKNFMEANPDLFTEAENIKFYNFFQSVRAKGELKERTKDLQIIDEIPGWVD